MLWVSQLKEFFILSLFAYPSGLYGPGIQSLTNLCKSHDVKVRRSYITPCANLCIPRHALKPECHGTVHHAGGNGIACLKKSGRARGAVVVHIDDRDLRIWHFQQAGHYQLVVSLSASYLCHTQLVQYALSRGTVAIDIAACSILDIIVAQVGVVQGLYSSLKAELLSNSVSERIYHSSSLSL